jgi:hypothetical protein
MSAVDDTCAIDALLSERHQDELRALVMHAANAAAEGELPPAHRLFHPELAGGVTRINRDDIELGALLATGAHKKVYRSVRGEASCTASCTAR